jgi:hypothetical protein
MLNINSIPVQALAWAAIYTINWAGRKQEW